MSITTYISANEDGLEEVEIIREASITEWIKNVFVNGTFKGSLAITERVVSKGGLWVHKKTSQIYPDQFRIHTIANTHRMKFNPVAPEYRIYAKYVKQFNERMQREHI